ncbi:hypothetical protein K439DRAFT_1362522 [Ramaria rubella]|nr:hypothetical protein K439DRAFT_1362522 [Ramaria rubella]
MNQTLCNNAVAMLIDVNLPKCYWAKAMAIRHDMTAYIDTRTPSAGLKGKTPYEKLFKRCVNALLFHPFGCKAYVLIPKDKRKGKFASKGQQCVMLGYEYGKKAYRLMDLD